MTHRKLTRVTSILLSLIFAALCSSVTTTAFGCTGCKKAAHVDKQSFGKTADGVAVDIYALTNRNGAKVRIITYGARVVSIEAPDRTGKLADVVLGYDDIAAYERIVYLGAIVGRYGNRIAAGRHA